MSDDQPRSPDDPDLEKVEDEARRTIDPPPGATTETPQHRASRESLRRADEDDHPDE